jgi:ankyrin repeat protein
MVREMPHRVRELHFAVKSNDRDTVRSLVAQGVNINFPFLSPSSSNPTTRDGNTPLIIAVSLNYTEIVEVRKLHGLSVRYVIFLPQGYNIYLLFMMYSPLSC